MASCEGHAGQRCRLHFDRHATDSLICKSDKGVAPARVRAPVLDEDDAVNASLSQLRAEAVWQCSEGSEDVVLDGERVKAPKKECARGCGADVACAVVDVEVRKSGSGHMLLTGRIVAEPDACALVVPPAALLLTVVDLDANRLVRRVIQVLAVLAPGEVREVWLDEGASVLDRAELCEAVAL